MNNKNKAGHVIKDDHIKRVKKLFKKNPIKLDCKIWTNEVEIELINIKIKLYIKIQKNLRLYTSKY